MMTMNERAARFFGKSVDAWFVVPPHFVELPWVRGTLKYRDRCVALVDGTVALWAGGRRDYDPDLWVLESRG
jgi:hypothetical protein